MRVPVPLPVYSNEGPVNGVVSESPQSLAADEEMIRVKEQAIVDLGSLLCRSGRGQELANLISGVRPFLSLVSKAKAAKLVRQLVDLLLDMDPVPASRTASADPPAASIGLDVDLVRDCMAWSGPEECGKNHAVDERSIDEAVNVRRDRKFRPPDVCKFLPPFLSCDLLPARVMN